MLVRPANSSQAQSAELDVKVVIVTGVMVRVMTAVTALTVDRFCDRRCCAGAGRDLSYHEGLGAQCSSPWHGRLVAQLRTVIQDLDCCAGAWSLSVTVDEQRFHPARASAY